MFLCVYKDWNDKQGVKHTTAEIQANLLQMLGGHTGNGYAPQSQPQFLLLLRLIVYVGRG